MKKVTLSIVIVVAVVVLALIFLSTNMTGNVAYSHIYTIPVNIQGQDLVFTWHERVTEGTCDQSKDPPSINIYEESVVSYKPRYRFQTTTQRDHCKNTDVLVEFACGTDLPASQNLYKPADFFLWIGADEVYGFEVNCPFGCSNGACKTG